MTRRFTHLIQKIYEVIEVHNEFVMIWQVRCFAGHHTMEEEIREASTQLMGRGKLEKLFDFGEKKIGIRFIHTESKLTRHHKNDKYVVLYLPCLVDLSFVDKGKQAALQRQFGQNLKKVRLTKGLTQMQLAVKAETDIRQIQRIEAGEIATSIAQAYLISRALEVTLDELMGG